MPAYQIIETLKQLLYDCSTLLNITIIYNNKLKRRSPDGMDSVPQEIWRIEGSPPVTPADRPKPCPDHLAERIQG